MGGLHSAVSEFVADNKYNVNVIPMGIPDRFIDQGTVNELISECGYNVDDIYKKLTEVYSKS
jgi:Deoxyxylulose-5-phosphate synthase